MAASASPSPAASVSLSPSVTASVTASPPVYMYFASQRANIERVSLSGGGSQTSIGSSLLGSPKGVFVQANGDVLVADWGYRAVRRIPGGTGTSIAIGSGWSNPSDVFATSNGDVWVVDELTNQVKVVRGGAGTPVAFGPLNGFKQPWAVFVTASGDVYVTDYGNAKVKRFANGDGSVAPTIVCSGKFRGIFVTPQNVAYVADADNGEIKTCAGGNATTVATNLPSPYDVSVTAAGDVYVLLALATPSVKKLPGGNASAIENVAGTSNIGGTQQSFYIAGTVYSGA